jgi:hypothetical protein
VGAIIHLLIKFNNSKKRRGVKFNWKRQIAQTLIGLISVYTIIYVRNDFSNLIEINKVTAVFLGYLGDSTFKNLLKTFQSKLTPNQ